MRVGIPKKGSSKALPHVHQCPILPKVGELMVNDQQCDSHEGRFRQVSLECFIVELYPVLSSVGVKAWSGKEDTTLLSMADCRVKQATVSTATRYGIKPRIQGCPRGSVRIEGQNIRYYKTKREDALDNDAERNIGRNMKSKGTLGVTWIRRKVRK